MDRPRKQLRSWAASSNKPALVLILFAFFSIVGNPAWAVETKCAPAGSLWAEASAEATGQISFAPRMDLRLHVDADKTGAIAAEDFLGEERGKRFPITNAVSIYSAAHGFADISLVGYSDAFYLAIIPPGTNNSLFPEAPELKTGRAGAIALIPYDPVAFCQKYEAPGILIHAGNLDDVDLLRRVPSMLMKEDDLAQIIADYIALANGEADAVGKPYKFVLERIQGVVGADAFRPSYVNIRMTTHLSGKVEGARFGSRVEGYPARASAKTLPYPVTLPMRDLVDFYRQNGEGYLYWMETYLEKQSSFVDLFNKAQIGLDNPNLSLDQRRQRLESISRDAAELLVFIPNYLRILEEAKASGRIPAVSGPMTLEQHLAEVRNFAQKLEKLRFEATGDVITLRHLTGAERLNLAKELDPPNLPTPTCTLTPLKRKFPVRALPTPLGIVTVRGQGILFFENAPASPGNVVARVRIGVDVNDFRRLQSVIANGYARENSTNCGRQVSIDSNDLVADGQGRLAGATHFAIKLYACATYKVPCWKDWKQYMCKHTNSAHIATFGGNQRFGASASITADGVQVDLSGPSAFEQEITLKQIVGNDDQLRQAFSLLSIRSQAAYFSENDDGVWLMLEMAGAPKIPAIMCGIRDQIQSPGTQ